MNGGPLVAPSDYVVAQAYLRDDLVSVLLA